MHIVLRVHKQQLPVIARAMLRAEGGMDRPDHLTIRFTKEFEENYALTFKKELAGSGEMVGRGECSCSGQSGHHQPYLSST